MKIVVTHPSSINYTEELYEPLRNSDLNSRHDIFLPHEESKNINTSDIIRNCDLVIAEVSAASTGQGIELGWADKYNKKVIFLYKKGSHPSVSLQKLMMSPIKYNNASDMLDKLSKVIKQYEI